MAAPNPILDWKNKQTQAPSVSSTQPSSSNPILEWKKTTETPGISSGPTELQKQVFGENASQLPRNYQEARDLQEKDPSLWGKVSEQLMKPIGIVATTTEDLGTAIGRGDISVLKQTPSKIGGIITGTQKNSFVDIWQENGAGIGLSPKVSSAIGLLVDIAADPLNFIGGGLTKAGKVADKAGELLRAGEKIRADSKLARQIKALGLTTDQLKLGATKAEQVMLGQRALLSVMGHKVIGGAPIYRATEVVGSAIKQTAFSKIIRTAFSTKTENEAFNVVREHFDNLAGYRRGKVMDEALDIQNNIAQMGEGEALKVLDVIESGKNSGVKAIDEMASRLINNFKGLRDKEKELGLLKSEIQDYFPHIRVKDKIGVADKLKLLFAKPRKYSTALGSSKLRTIEGSVNEINKTFGTEFFESRPAVAFAQRALASARAVTSKEFFNSVKQFAVKEGADGIETSVQGLKGHKFAPDVAKAIDQYNESLKPEVLNSVAKIFDGAQNWWKAQALVSPSYHVRNMAGNLWNNFLAGVTDPKVYFEAGLAQMGKKMPAFTDDAGRVWDQASLIEAAKKTGVLGEGWYAKDIQYGLGSEMSANSWNPLRQNFGLFRANRAVGQAFENNARLGHFISKLKEGHSIDVAAQSVKKYLFDYGDLTDLERTVLKRVAPFYTWTRKNVPLQLKALMEQPAKFAGVAKTQNAIESNVPKPNEKYLTNYIKDNIGLRVGTDENGNTLYFLMGQWLPAAQAIDFLSQPVQNMLVMLTPFLKTPTEIWANKSMFFEDTLNQGSPIERYPEENVSFLGLTMRKKTAAIARNIRILNELDKLNPGRIFGDEKNPSLWYNISPDAKVRLPGVGTITPSNRQVGKFQPESTQGNRILQVMFGKTQIYNPAIAKQYFLWDTQTKIKNLKAGIKDALRDGQKEYAKSLQEELKKFQKSR